MIKFKKILCLVAILPISFSLFSQNAADGLRFSQTFNTGTARFVSMGGAFGALGADFTSLSINPAGLGVYKSSEFTITPTFNRRSITSAYNGVSASDTKNRLNFDNIGFVMSFNPYSGEEKGIVNFNIGFGYTRTNDFNSNSISTGNYDQYSMMRYFETKANKTNLSPASLEFADDFDPFRNNGSGVWDLVMAWNTFLLFEYDQGSGNFISALFPDDLVDHQNVISTKGGAGEYDISFSMNVSNKLFLGATMGITDYSYTYNSTYSEVAEENNPWDLNGDRFYNFYYSQFYETKGTGYNLKIGAIYNPIPSIRLGAAIHTPSFYSFDDTYSSTIKTNFDTSHVEVNYKSASPLGKYDYDFETPFKFVGSVAYVIKNIGLISVDIERIDYSTMKFRNGGDGDNFSDLNIGITNAFKNVTNIRIGGEYKINDFALRAGYAYYPSPYKKGYINDKANTQQISGGFGYRSGNFSIDMAYLRTLKSENSVYYDDPDMDLPPIVKTDIKDGKFLVTLGFRF